MGVVTEDQRRHYFGTAADMATIVAACRCAGDLYYQTDTKALFIWSGAAWEGPVPADWITAAMLKTDSVETLKIKALNVTKGKAELGFGRYVPRPVAAHDFGVGNFTTDGTWKVHGMDLTGIVPEGTTGVIFSLLINDDAANSEFRIRRDAADHVALFEARTFVVNIGVLNMFIVPIDSDRLLDYYGANLAFTVINASVVGYFI